MVLRSLGGELNLGSAIRPEPHVVRPHPQDLDDPITLEDLIDEAVLDVDPAGLGASEIAERLLEGRLRPPRILSEDSKEFFSLRSQARGW